MKHIEYCSNCGFKCDDSYDAFWFEDEHYCQDCYMSMDTSLKPVDPQEEREEVL